MNEKVERAAEEADENRLIAERRVKLDALRDEGQAFPNDFRTNAVSHDLHVRFCDALSEELEDIPFLLTVVGDVVEIRGEGDASGRPAVRADRSGRRCGRWRASGSRGR